MTFRASSCKVCGPKTSRMWQYACTGLCHLSNRQLLLFQNRGSWQLKGSAPTLLDSGLPVQHACAQSRPAAGCSQALNAAVSMHADSHAAPSPGACTAHVAAHVAGPHAGPSSAAGPPAALHAGWFAVRCLSHPSCLIIQPSKNAPCLCVWHSTSWFVLMCLVPSLVPLMMH